MAANGSRRFRGSAIGSSPSQWRRRLPREGRPRGTGAPVPRGPSVPNLSGDPEQDYFADGVVEDIITALSRFKSFAVIARNSSFVYKGRNVDVRQVAEDLGVRYVLEGSVRRAGNRLRITAQLVEGGSGAHIWADNFDGALDDVFDFQDRITRSVATLVEPLIQTGGDRTLAARAAEEHRGLRHLPERPARASIAKPTKTTGTPICCSHEALRARSGQRASSSPMWPMRSVTV